MVCNICLSNDIARMIDRLDLCERCYRDVIKRLEEIGDTKTQRQ